jgi:hypothetical protein
MATILPRIQVVGFPQRITAVIRPKRSEPVNECDIMPTDDFARNQVAQNQNESCGIPTVSLEQSSEVQPCQRDPIGINGNLVKFLRRFE